MTEIYASKVYGILGGGATISNLISASGTASVALATTTITGDVRMAVLGTFGSATVSLQIRDPNGVYAEVSGSPITAAAQNLFSFPQYCRNTFRVNRSQSAANTNLAIWLQGAKK